MALVGYLVCDVSSPSSGAPRLFLVLPVAHNAGVSMWCMHTSGYDHVLALRTPLGACTWMSFGLAVALGPGLPPQLGPPQPPVPVPQGLGLAPSPPPRIHRGADSYCSYLLEAVLSWVQAQWLPLTYGRVAEAQHGTAACPGLHSSWAPSAACCSEVLSPLPCAAQQVEEHLPGERPSLSTVSM